MFPLFCKVVPSYNSVYRWGSLVTVASLGSPQRSHGALGSPGIPGGGMFWGGVPALHGEMPEWLPVGRSPPSQYTVGTLVGPSDRMRPADDPMDLRLEGLAVPDEDWSLLILTMGMAVDMFLFQNSRDLSEAREARQEGLTLALDPPPVENLTTDDILVAWGLLAETRWPRARGIHDEDQQKWFILRHIETAEELLPRFLREPRAAIMAQRMAVLPRVPDEWVDEAAALLGPRLPTGQITQVWARVFAGSFSRCYSRPSEALLRHIRAHQIPHPPAPEPGSPEHTSK